MSCDCKFEPDPSDPLEDGTPGNRSWHYKRTCSICDFVWWSLHCAHDGYQNPCPNGHRNYPCASCGEPFYLICDVCDGDDS